MLGDANRLRALQLVLDLGSMSAAADVLGYTQSAVSQQISSLERELGTRLVDRSRRPLQPTAEATLLRPHFDKVIASAAEAEAAVRDLHGSTTRLRVAAFPSALSSFVPAAIRDIGAAHPQLVVQMRQLEGEDAIEHLRRGEVDVAVVHWMPGASVPATGELRRQRLLVDDLYVLVPRGHALDRDEAIAMSDLADEPLVLPSLGSPAAQFRALVERLCARAGFSPRVAYEIDDPPAAQALVAAGIALVPMHGLLLATAPRGTVAVPLSDDSGSRPVEALAPPAARSPTAEDLVRRLIEAARAYDAEAVSPGR